jgi:hypothetical protein
MPLRAVIVSLCGQSCLQPLAWQVEPDMVYLHLKEVGPMRRSILTIGLALLLSFTAIIRPVSAADMPLKAPPPPVVTPVVAEFCWPCLLLAAGIIAGVLCAVECHHNENNERPVTFGAPQAL